MIALDSNVLVYAHRGEAEWNEEAFALVDGLAEGQRPWAIPFPCIHEFLRNVTDPRIYRTPTPLDAALRQVADWASGPTLRLISEGERHLDVLSEAALEGRVRGAMIHDARIAAICLEHGVQELWTADRDFSRFPALKTRNPLVG
ncbi:MAG TPA: TA system VapC family ribonuclease toxin [Conexibacter sp.]|nr:TA system VapC family ribonuclease toxin [Conexibacter sp.]